MKEIRAMIFDLDGTLADTERLHHRAWEKTLNAHGVEEFTLETFMKYVGTSNEKVASDFIVSHTIGRSISELVVYKQNIYMELIPEVRLHRGAKEIIEAFAGRMKLAVASSSHSREVNAILNAHGLGVFFTSVICGDMVERLKPDPEIYLKTSGILQVEPASCMAFEDSTHGLKAAKSAGMYSVVVPNEFTREHDFSRADAVLENLSDILARIPAGVQLPSGRMMSSSGSR